MICFKIFLLIPSIIIVIINATIDDFNCTYYAAKGCSYQCETKICASNRECEQWFCNECTFNVANCIAEEYHDAPWGLVPNGKCECPTRCQNDFNPVCGFSEGNYRHFSSQCSLDKINCETNHDWEKVDIELCDQPEKCPIFCRKEYSPICAYNGSIYQEFPNNCLFNLANCHESNNWGAFIIGTCPDCYNWEFGPGQPLNTQPPPTTT